VIVRLVWATRDLECSWRMNRVACSQNPQRLLQKHGALTGRVQGSHSAAIGSNVGKPRTAGARVARV
jgi:hypothetical protein